jgi:hypothetical protein
MSTKPSQESSNKKRSADGAPETSAAAAKKIAEAPKSPHDQFMDKFEAFIKENDFHGAMMTKQIAGKEKADKSYTEKQMSTLRFVLLTKARNDVMDEMKRLVLKEQADSPFAMFSTSFSYQVHDSFYEEFKPLYDKKKTLTEKFDILLGYTNTISDHDVWMHDNEGDMDGMVKDLAGLWKKLLKNTDEALGIDAEYTRPGVIALLKDFKKQVEACYSEPKFKFNF